MTLNISTRFRPAVVGAVTCGLVVAALLPAVPASAAAPGRLAGAAPAAPVAAPLAPRSAAPAGKLTPRGCTSSAGSASCDLYAMTGSASILGNPVPIWGFSSTGVDGSATIPGPLLVVNQGDQVTITLHNQLTENVSLAFPGQAATAFSSSGYGDDVTGAGAGGNRVYSFTAGRPGTFLYEAGHTADGARQVAMGLAGALVVLPGDGTGYGSSAQMPNTSYDDDATLVLSEIDPALNAHPATFDMRNFSPRYRLINGKPYPSTDPVSTDQGHRVLLRYVNAGSQTHAMSVLGATQTEVAQDGHPLKYATTVVADSIDPGATLDTIVTTPTGPESKLAIYEPAGRLDNNGQNTADPQQIAFGGMMTFLDTNAPAPSTDGVGPTSTHVKASPNPSDGLADVTVTADLSDATTGGSSVSQAEYVVDDAVTTGVGFGVPMTGPFGSVDVPGASGTLPAVPAGGQPCQPAVGAPPVALSCLDAGKHTIFVRALDAAGNWGVVGSVVFNLPKTGPQTTNGSAVDSPANGKLDVDISATGDDSAAGGTITAAEYFMDSAGANGTGTPLSRNRTAAVVSEDGTLLAADVAGLTEGTHHILVHSKDSLNLWGPTLDIPLVVDTTGPGVDAASVGPNPTNALIADKSHPGSLLISTQITDRDTGGALQSPLVAAEAFIDKTTGAGGSGLQLIAVDGKFNSTSEAAYGLIPLSQIKPLTDGVHHVYVRGKDSAGNWGQLFGVNLLVDKIAPVLGALTATPNPTNGAAALTASAPLTEVNTLGAAEYWFGTTDPGAGHASSVPFSVAGGQVSASVPLAGVPAGAQQLNLRVQDLAGNWSKSVNRSVTIVPPNAIFSSNFESGSLSDWSATTGTISSATGAKVVTSNEPGSTRGMQVVSSTFNRAAYVTDNSPTAEATYHARFAFNRNTLTTGTNTATALTLFEGRSATAQVFALQFRTTGSGTATQAQLRTVLNGSNGTRTGGWVNLAPGAHTIQLDWAAATAGTVVLKIDGATAQTSQAANTSTLRIETAWLGVAAGWATGTTGTVFFDTFASARNTL